MKSIFDEQYYIIFKQNHFHFRKGDQFQIAASFYFDMKNATFYDSVTQNYYTVDNSILNKISTAENPEYFI